MVRQDLEVVEIKNTAYIDDGRKIKRITFFIILLSSIVCVCSVIVVNIVINIENKKPA